MSGPFGSSTFAYNGLGDRLTQNGVNYTLDLNMGLTQVLSDGTNTYLYGVGRIVQVNTTTLVTDYFMTDALGSVRQLTDAQGAVTLANAYEPYGSLAQTAGGAQTSYGFTGEYTDPSGMVYLRARYYSPAIGRFQTRDTWMGDSLKSVTYNKWLYGNANPIRYTDPTGLYAKVDCSKINPSGLRYYCNIGNGDENNPDTIDARWMFFSILANTSIQFGALSEGYFYAGKNLKTFLSGQSFSQIKLPSYSGFGYDYGILRATKIKLPQGRSLDGGATDDPTDIRPLLYVFLQDHVQLALTSCTTYLLSSDFKVKSRETWSGPYSPRPYDTGWWGAFGHVEIDATYSNTFVIPIGSFYYVSTKVP